MMFRKHGTHVPELLLLLQCREMGKWAEVNNLLTHYTVKCIHNVLYNKHSSRRRSAPHSSYPAQGSTLFGIIRIDMQTTTGKQETFIVPVLLSTRRQHKQLQNNNNNNDNSITGNILSISVTCKFHMTKHNLYKTIKLRIILPLTRLLSLC